MNTGISTNYRELAIEEVAAIAESLSSAWMDPEIPRRQYERATKHELEALRAGKPPCAPFRALVECMAGLPRSLGSVLDVGASAGYYREVLELAGFTFEYTGLDFSPAFKELAEELYPGITFDVGDATALTYADAQFDLVLSGANIMHVWRYAKAIAEAARVSKRWVLFHRTPITEGPTRYWVKDAYGIPTLEIWFSEFQLLRLFAFHGLRLLKTVDVFGGDGFYHRDYLLEKA